MDKMIDFFTEHGEALGGLVAVILVFVARFTPTPKDDAWFAKILGMLNLLPEGAKETLAASKETE